MSLTEALSRGAMVTVTGLAIVFLVLIILMLVMMAMKKIFYKEPKSASVKTVPPAAESKSEPVQSVQPTDDTQLIAVLAAAVAASLGTTVSGIKIKSYRRVSASAPAWNRAGIRDVIDSRF